MTNKIYYHGTSAQNITEFQFGKKNIGECITPVNGIWLSSRIEGATRHAGIVSNKRKTMNGYVYRIEICDSTLIADATASSLPVIAFKCLQRSLPLYKRWIVKNKNWYGTFAKNLNISGNSDEELRNEVIKRSLNVKVDAIINPVVSINNDMSTNNYNEGYYGTTLLLINLKKAISITLVSTV